MKAHLSRFLLSPLGVGLLLLHAAAAVALPAVFGAPVVPVAAGAAASFFLAVLVLLQTPLGAAAVVAEKDRERDERDARVLGGVAAARKRLTLLRIEDEAVAEARTRLAYAAGLYLEASVRGAPRDPAAEDAVLGAVEAMDDYLRMADASSAGRRFRGGQAGTENARGDAAVVARTARALLAAAEAIEERVAASSGGLASGLEKNGISAADRAAAREELE